MYSYIITYTYIAEPDEFARGQARIKSSRCPMPPVPPANLVRMFQPIPHILSCPHAPGMTSREQSEKCARVQGVCGPRFARG